MSHARPSGEDGDDFGRWVGPHLLAMSHLAARLAGESSRDDVVQESLARAWRRWTTFDPGRGTPRGWLLAVVADQARRTRVRNRGLSSQRSTGLSPAVRAVEGPDLEGDVDLRRAVGSLPRRQRLAVELRYYVGLSVAETAEVMGCAEGTVKATLAQARSRLRERLEVET